MNTNLDPIVDRASLNPNDPKEIRYVALAFLGDSVFDLYLRRYLVLGTSLNAHEMHLNAAAYACAKTQARIAMELQDYLTEEEKSLLIKARNHKSISPPKNQNPVDYKWATALEALIGYLSLTDEERCKAVFDLGIQLYNAWSNEHAL